MDSIPGSGRSPGEGNGRPLQYSCLENSMDWGAWRATVHEVTKIWTWLNETHMEKEMQPTPVLFPGKLHGLRSLVGYSPWGCKESDTTEQLHFHYTAIQNKHFFLLICFLSHKFFLLQTIYDFHCPVPGKSLFQTGFSQTTQSFRLTPWSSPAFKHSVC